jgi:hypothetical protein
MYENQRDQMYAQQMNLESANFMTQQLKDTADQVAVMKQAQMEISAQMKKVNIDDVDVLQEQMQDLWVRLWHIQMFPWTPSVTTNAVQHQPPDANAVRHREQHG